MSQHKVFLTASWGKKAKGNKEDFMVRWNLSGWISMSKLTLWRWGDMFIVQKKNTLYPDFKIVATITISLYIPQKETELNGISHSKILLVQIKDLPNLSI